MKKSSVVIVLSLLLTVSCGGDEDDSEPTVAPAVDILLPSAGFTTAMPVYNQAY